MTRFLGSTGLPVTHLGLGLAALGRPSYINLGRDDDLGPDRSVEAMERRCHEMLDAAYAAGIRYVDAARSYGFAERFLASWLQVRRVLPGTITVGSKWGYRYVAEWRLDAPIHEVKDLSLDTLRRQVAESRELLGARLGLYQIHSATIESGVLDDRRVLEELVQLGAEGLTIGLTVTGPRQAETIRRALAVEVEGVNPFRCVQATWNVLEQSAAPALAEAHAQGWGVIIKEVLANGRLRDRVDIALAAADAQPWADVILSGAVTPAQLAGSIAALDRPLPTGDRARLEALGEPADVYWARRATLEWS